MITLTAPPEKKRFPDRNGKHHWRKSFHCSDGVIRDMKELMVVTGLSQATIDRNIREMPFDSPDLLKKKVRRKPVIEKTVNHGTPEWQAMGGHARTENLRKIRPLGRFERRCR